MDVVLLKSVERLGTEGCVVAVRPGYARNYLIPNGLALPATPQRLRMLEELKTRREQQAARIRQRALALKRKLESRSVTLTLSLGEGGKPFGSVTVHDIAQALQEDQFPVEKPAIQLEEPIKALGIYEVPVRLHPEVTATLKLWVVKA
jgi:large subunit ribosomal protein L9